MEARWKKSSRSQGANNCVELANAGGGSWRVRDGKCPAHQLDGIAVPALLAAVKAGWFDR